MRYILDTSALLAHARKEAGFEFLEGLFDNQDAELYVSCLSLPEFSRRAKSLGVSAKQAWDDAMEYAEMLSGIHPVNLEIAREAYTLGEHCPQRLPLIDALIAATAKVQGATLVHRDKHLTALPQDLVKHVPLGIAA